MPNTVGIIYTTFLRNELAEQTIESIQPSLNKDVYLFIGDQNKENNKCLPSPKCKFTFYYPLPYDCGLSYSRNFLVNRAEELRCEYCLLTADSICFVNNYDFSPHINFLKEKDSRAIIGFEILNRQSYEYDLELSNKFDKFVLIEPRRPKINNYQPCDIVRNFFIAKTSVLKEIKWDNNLGLCEHEDFFYRLKQKGYEVFYTNELHASYLDHKPEEYKKMRNRLYGEFKDRLKNKYNLDNIGSWILYNHKLSKEDRI